MRSVYKECMRNHAATLGTYAADGCCEFMLDDSRPDLLHCAACGCHRNFHRRSDNALPKLGPAGYWLPPDLLLEDGQRRRRTRFSVSQKVRMASFAEKIGWKIPRIEGSEEEDEVSKFCSEIGVSRQVFKVWIHNHKNNTAEVLVSSPSDTANGAVAPVSPADGDEVKDAAGEPMEEGK